MITTMRLKMEMYYSILRIKPIVPRLKIQSQISLIISIHPESTILASSLTEQDSNLWN